MRFESARKTLRSFDYLLFAAVAGLVSIGIVFIHSASTWRGEWGEMASYTDYAPRQFQWAMISVGVFFAILVPRYTRLKTAAYAFYAVMFAVLVSTLFIGTGPERSPVRRWIEVKLGGVHIADFQPSQVMEVAVVMALAAYLMYKEEIRLRHIAVAFMLTGMPMLVILKQPDLGTALLFAPLPFIMLFAAGARLAHLATIAGLGVAMVPVFWTVMKEYQKARFLAWLNPWRYESGTGWQYIHSRIAVGSGGILGMGLGKGTQNSLKYLAEKRTDFIFAVICEEWGFIGALLVVFLYALIVLCGLGIASRTRDPFGRLLVVGVVTLISTQTFINMGMNVGLMPITGLTLPFISYGGSSLLASFIAVGIMMNVAVHPVVTLARDRY